VKPHDEWTFKRKNCARCGVEYTPTGSRSKYCPVHMWCSPGSVVAKEWRQNYAKLDHVKTKVREWQRKAYEKKLPQFVNQEFVDRVREKIQKRRGNIISVKPVTKRVLYNMEILQKMEWKSGIELAFCYRIVERELIAAGGKYFSETYGSGKQFQFPTLKEREG
jgi:hypothetical protein